MFSKYRTIGTMYGKSPGQLSLLKKRIESLEEKLSPEYQKSLYKVNSEKKMTVINYLLEKLLILQ